MVWTIASACGAAQQDDGAASDASNASDASGEAGEDPAAPIAEDDFVAALADLLCDLQAECTCDDALPEAECRDMLAASIEVGNVPAPEAGLVFDEQCAGEVLADWAELGCGSIFAMPQPDVCAPCPLYHGNRGAGEACTPINDGQYDDCERGLRCNSDRVCDVPCATVGEGEDCTSKACGPGLFCQYTDPDPEEHGNEPVGVCRPAAQYGESCNIQLECDAGLVCAYTNECIEWDGAQVGEPCGYGCADGLLCNPEPPYECLPRAAVGEPCYAPADCASGRCDPQMLVCEEEQAAACFG